LAVLLAAPAAAGSRVGHHSNCPKERARLAALAQQERAHAAELAQALRVPKGPTRVTLTEGAPSARWLFGFDGVPRSLTP
jgi:hypothetical protein